jgi:hypothetical protein
MFNWICPECGRDVPPSATECRFCAERKKAAETAGGTVETAVPVAAPVADPTPAYSAPPPAQPMPQPPAPQPTYAQQYAPPQPQYAPAPPQQPYYPPPPQYAPQPVQQPYYPPPGQQPGYPPAKAALPTWAMALIFGLGFIVLIGAVFFGYQHMGKGSQAEATSATKGGTTTRGNPTNPLQKYIEVVGIRLVEDQKHKPEARFIVVNHSNAELADLDANVTLWASTSKSDEEPVGTFSFKLDSIGGNESKEITAPLNTKLKIYELPDWQNATAEVQLSKP